MTLVALSTKAEEILACQTLSEKTLSPTGDLIPAGKIFSIWQKAQIRFFGKTEEQMKLSFLHHLFTLLPAPQEHETSDLPSDQELFSKFQTATLTLRLPELKETWEKTFRLKETCLTLRKEIQEAKTAQNLEQIFTKLSLLKKDLPLVHAEAFLREILVLEKLLKNKALFLIDSLALSIGIEWDAIQKVLTISDVSSIQEYFQNEPIALQTLLEQKQPFLLLAEKNPFFSSCKTHLSALEQDLLNETKALEQAKIYLALITQLREIEKSPGDIPKIEKTLKVAKECLCSQDLSSSLRKSLELSYSKAQTFLVTIYQQELLKLQNRFVQFESTSLPESFFRFRELYKNFFFLSELLETHRELPYQAFLTDLNHSFQSFFRCSTIQSLFTPPQDLSTLTIYLQELEKTFELEKNPFSPFAEKLSRYQEEGKKLGKNVLLLQTTKETFLSVSYARLSQWLSPKKAPF